MAKRFYGWWIIAAAFCTFGLAVGLPYYNMPFFYDYYEKTYGWSRPDITLGFPLAALLTLWVGPVLVPRVSPRKLILTGTLLTLIAFMGFGRMTGSLTMYYALWFAYTVGYILSGPIAHQVIVSNWFRKKRGTAMGLVYVGVGLVGAMGAPLVKYFSEHYTFQTALQVVGGLVLLAWPIAIFLLKDKPAEVGQYPDGAEAAHDEVKAAPLGYRFILRQREFWLLLVGSACSIGAIGAINQHMKLVFKDQGFTNQQQLNSAWGVASVLILISSIAGRLMIGWLADRFSKKTVMVSTYVIVAVTIPVLLLVRPEQEYYLYVFAVVFGFAMGADYMLIPLMAADQFGVNTLARVMAVTLPTNTIGQTWFPWAVSLLRRSLGDYNRALMIIFVVAFIGAIAIAMLPAHKSKRDETLHLQDAGRADARS
jgi:MFS family permease